MALINILFNLYNITRPSYIYAYISLENRYRFGGAGKLSGSNTIVETYSYNISVFILYRNDKVGSDFGASWIGTV